MPAFLVVKVLESQSICLPSTLVYSNVELRSASADFEEESRFLENCAKSLHLDFSKYSHCARIATIVDELSIPKAVEIADDRFAEILDLKSIEAPISNFSLSKIGFVKDLLKGSLHEIKDNTHRPSMAFFTHQGDVQQVDMTHYVLAQNTELSNRYLRSLHWLRNSKHENNYQLKILFNWFAVEALLKESEMDNIGATIRWFLGFPNGKSSKLVSSSVITALEANPRYGIWKKKIKGIIEKIRIFRNDSTHHGFRTIDFTKKELELFNQVMLFGATRCQGAVQLALHNQVSTVPEFKDYMPYLFELNENLVNDVHGNIIFSLDRINDT
ncbi:hypothetical protein [Vibrio sp. 99-70-13A1]|uniref:hypothetical protein n=1 Tax=Vibrio sp. 99-70-13A1 TaxID=2607601 RepID=UPI001493BB42|nr:hypothetical protein [Vibrio sp. 99-70-13A1]NOH98873.1 hypothetical protein [Vibrio sp. 99-70-13A1]